MTTPRSISLGALLAAVLWASPAGGQSFSCSFGSEPACLDYGAVVCKRGATCVAKDAVCFDSYTCDYKGFVCKSKLDDAVDAYETQLSSYNELVDKFNSLKSTYEEVVEQRAAALSAAAAAVADIEGARRQAANLSECVASANTVDDAKACASNEGLSRFNRSQVPVQVPPPPPGPQPPTTKSPFSIDNLLKSVQ